jgi:ribosomal protein S27AE
MTVLVADRQLTFELPRRFDAEPGRRAASDRPATGDAGGRSVAEGSRLTLDDLIVGVWEDLLSRRPAACPMCGGTMTALDERGGACGGCGATLT